MTEEEIRSRILICEIRERDYREVGNAKTAERYRNEIYKWEELLDKINPKNYEDLQKYKYGYIRLEKENQQLKNELEQSNAVADTNKELSESFHKEIERLKRLLKYDYEDSQEIMAELTNEKQELKEQLQQKENIIDKVEDYIIKHNLFNYKYDEEELYEIVTDNKARTDLLEILDNKGE